MLLLHPANELDERLYTVGHFRIVLPVLFPNVFLSCLGRLSLVNGKLVKFSHDRFVFIEYVTRSHHLLLRNIVAPFDRHRVSTTCVYLPQARSPWRPIAVFMVSTAPGPCRARSCRRWSTDRRVRSARHHRARSVWRDRPRPAHERRTGAIFPRARPRPGCHEWQRPGSRPATTRRARRVRSSPGPRRAYRQGNRAPGG